MDKKALSYHTKVQDWTQLYRLTADGKIYKDTKEITYLSPQKIQEIDSWRNNVYKKLTKNKSAGKQLNIQTFSSSKQKSYGSSQVKCKSAINLKHNKDTDVFSVSNHLAETSLHYSAMRKDIYNANKKQSIPQSTKSILNGTATEVSKKFDKAIQFKNSVDRKSSSQGSDNKLEEDVISDSISDSISLASTRKMTECGKVIQVKDKMMISVRSVSNNLLNVISIDDCKMALAKNSFVYTAERTKSQTSEYKAESSAANSTDMQKPGKRSMTAESRKTSSYYTSTMPSGISGRESKPDRKARVTKAIDTMVNDRKVMNTMDRNFDARIAPAGRLILNKNEGGYMFKRLHSALRKHVDNILSVQAHRRLPKQLSGMEDQFSSYIQQIASSIQTDDQIPDPSAFNKDFQHLSSNKKELKGKLTIFEEEEDIVKDENVPKRQVSFNKQLNEKVEQTGKDNDVVCFGHSQASNQLYIDSVKCHLTAENVTLQDKLSANCGSSSSESLSSSVSIHNLSEKC
ncbi:uncharacterized protein LOC127709716 [Mytilus californianus]|uniref:uncharacterized protein LOC127709716 n=1 Tax=Mytilus californianus TaxID=6549 RepID=UPI0022459CFE|nr:uncharacterized protein LOC127709716 [Mytilus californianus]